MNADQKTLFPPAPIRVHSRPSAVDAWIISRIASKHTLLFLTALELAATIAIAAPAPSKQPSAEELARMERAAPAKAPATPHQPRKLLVISQCEGFVHSAIPYAEKALEIVGRKTGAFTTVVVNDFSIFEKPELDSFDGIVMNNCTVREPLLELDTAKLDTAGKAQAEARETRARQRFVDFVRNGKGLIGIHAATDCLYKWADYGELLGGYFDGHPWHESVRVKLDDPGHSILAAFSGLDFDVTDEIYQFREPYSREKLHVLMSLDASKLNLTKQGIKREDKDFAVAWVQTAGKGRVFFCSLGHREEIFWNSPVLACYLAGIQYAVGDLPADATPSTKLTTAYLEQSRATAAVAGLDNLLAALATFKLGENDRVAQAMDTFVDAHQADGDPCRPALSKGLAAVAANPQATPDSRILACRKLRLVGTDAAVPALAGLLTDKQLGDWALSALAGIPGEAADRALLDSLSRAEGKDRVGIAGLLGQRRVPAAEPALAGLLTGEAAWAVTAAEALGQIGDAKSCDLLAVAQGKASTVRAAVDRALLACGETARQNNDKQLALKAYSLLNTPATAAHVRAAALYGRGLASGETDAVRLIVDALLGSDEELARAGARLAADLPGERVTLALADKLRDLAPARRILALNALAARSDRAAEEAILAQLGEVDAKLRTTALKALETLGDAKAVAPVIKLAAEGIEPARTAARHTLEVMNGPGVDEAIVAAIRTADVKSKTELVRVLGVRKTGVTVLIAAARDSDPTLAREARKALGVFPENKDLPELVRLVCETSNPGALDQLESILVKAAQKAADDAGRTTALLDGLKQNPPVPATATLLTALGRIGAAPALPVLKAALESADLDLRRAAIKALAEHWPNAAPLEVLRNASRKDADKVCRVLALRGYARLVAMPSERPVKETLGLYRDALALAQGDQERRALIGGLGNLTHPEALAYAKTFFTDSTVQAEAVQAAYRVMQNLNGRAMVLTASKGKGSERNAIDGSPKTRWTTGAPMAGGEWFLVDLGYETDLHEVYLDAGPEGHDQPRGYEVYVSLDGKTWGAAVAKGGDPGKSAFTITLPPVNGRFVKIVQTGANNGLFWSINEMKINGLPDSKAGTPLDRSTWKLSASRSGGGCAPENAIGGNPDKRWGTGGGMRPDDWFQVDLGVTATVSRVVMDAAKSGGDYPREYQIYTSLDGVTWLGPVGAGKGEKALTTAVLLPTQARFVKIAQTGSSEGNWWSIYDLQVFGE